MRVSVTARITRMQRLTPDDNVQDQDDETNDTAAGTIVCGRVPVCRDGLVGERGGKGQGGEEELEKKREHGYGYG